MKSKIIFAAVFIILVIAGLFIWRNKNEKIVQKTNPLIPFSLAMDWTPNTNHTGIYVALAKGWYKAQGLDVKLLPYSPNVSADLLVSTGKADAGISYTEGVVSDAASGNPVVSIAAVIQHNTSSLVALADSGIKRPRDFDGKIYGGFGAPYENAVVGEIIKRDGGKGKFKNVTSDVEGLSALQTHKIDFAWIFDGWTGVQAQRQGLKLISFPINSNGIADYYTPTIIASKTEIKQKHELLQKFMTATIAGYVYAISHPQEAAQFMIDNTPKGTFPDPDFVIASQKYLSPRYVDAGHKWGLQDRNYWHDYPQFMLDSGAVSDGNGKPVKTLDFDSLYTNEFIQ